jgi:hypothetical protein
MSTDGRLPYVHLINKCVALSSIQEAKDRCRYTRLYSHAMLKLQDIEENQLMTKDLNDNMHCLIGANERKD